jgi:diadenosine tetraphosphate (Ap4A) HIT family hydrolase
MQTPNLKEQARRTRKMSKDKTRNEQTNNHTVPHTHTHTRARAQHLLGWTWPTITQAIGKLADARGKCNGKLKLKQRRNVKRTNNSHLH